MPNTHRAIAIAAAFLILGGAAQPQSPYVGQEARDIKALSQEEVSAYLEGKGMGLAKTAELNGYPGPAHVLELAAPLALSAEQKAKTEAIFKDMQARAIPLGRELVSEERTLDQLFASHAVDSGRLAGSLERIGKLSAQVREVHLHAHLEQAALLTAQQITRYNELRGYGAGTKAQEHEHEHKH